MKPDVDVIGIFLSWVGAPWHLCAIPNDGGKPKGIWTDKVDQAVTFAETYNAKEGWNLYWTVNPLMRDPGAKPKEADVLEMRFIHVDVDPRAREDLEAEQDRILSLLEVANPKPSCLVFSGGGYQAFWRLTEPIPIRGQEAAYSQAKLYNKQMEINYDADACHNTDRLMRLPGTVNWPNKRKREKGRRPAMAVLISYSDYTYPIEMFTKAVEVQQPRALGSTKQVRVSGNIKRLDDLSELNGKVQDECISTINRGEYPDEPMRWDGDRSKAVWWVVCELVRGDIDDDTIFSIITDPDWGISAHVLAQSNPEGYAIRQIERAKEEAIAPELMELNDKYACTMVGGKFRILQEELRPGDDFTTLSYLTRADFRELLGNRFKVIDQDGKTMFLADWWLRQKHRRQYQGVVFYPSKDCGNYYNLWRGFAYQAKQGECDLYLTHLRDNLCQGNEEWFRYLIGWMAHVVQRPFEPGHTAVVLQGKQGTGKGFFAHTFGALFGRHYLPVRDSNHIFGQFNGHLEQCVLLFADESFWVGGKKQASMLKSLITEHEIVVERKGVDAVRSKNCVHLIMASNEAHVIAREDNDRRFFVLEVGDDRMQDNEYFGRIHDQLEAGGYEALLYMLLNHDISEFDVRDIPKTEAGRTQSDFTRDGLDSWWFEKLEDGRIFLTSEDWEAHVFRDELYCDYLQTVRGLQQRPVSRISFGRQMRKLLPPQTADRLRGTFAVMRVVGEEKVSVRDPKIYQTGTLEEVRAIWIREKGGEDDWPEPSYTEVEEEPF